MKSKPCELTEDYLEFSQDFNTDCGGWGFTWKCPDCGEQVSWAPYAWWRTECSCRTWTLDIKATGRPKE